jgi:hypothetical protein
MRLGTLLILTSSLVFLSAQAYAMPCRDDSCQKKVRADPGPSPAHQSLELMWARPGKGSFFARNVRSHGLALALEKRNGSPPGLRGRLDGWPASRFATPPVIPTSESVSDSAAPIPEPTALLLFGSGLLITLIGLRRGREARQIPG